MRYLQLEKNNKYNKHMNQNLSYQKNTGIRATVAALLVMLGICLLFAISTKAQTSQTFTSSGTFVVPAGVTTVQVEAWGGGGAGGGATTTNVGGGGGGGGAYAKSTGIAVTSGSSYTVTVGQGATGTTGNGASGTSSSFNTSTVVAAGGSGGIANTGGAGGAGGTTAASTGTTKFAGGNGAAGSGGNSGGGGGGAGTTAAGGNASGLTAGAGGATGGGAGGAGLSSAGDGNNGATYGGGGSGGRRGGSISFTRTGGDGADGRVIITWTCPTYSLTSTSAVTPICISSGTSTVSVTAAAANLPAGTYTVTYNRSNPSATGLTAAMTVSVAGSGSFTASGMTSAGSCTITVTGIASGASGGQCTSTISSNNAASVSVTGAPAAVAGTAVSNCAYTGVAVNVTAGSTASNYNTVTWTSNGTGTFSNPNSLTNCTYTPSAADVAAGSRTLTLTATPLSPCSGNATSSKTISFVALPSSVSATPVSSVICNAGNTVINAAATTTATNAAQSDNFNAATDSWTKTNNSAGATPADAAWKLRPDGYLYSTTTFHSNDNSQFYLSNSDDQGSGGTTATILASPAINTTNYKTLTLDFYHYYRFNSGAETAKVQVSTNGTSWTDVATYTSTQGSASSFAHPSITLNTYINNPTFYIRFKYDATFDWWWAIDNVTLNGVPVALFSWTSNTGSGVDGLPSGATTPSQSNKSITVNPSATTIYTLTATDVVTGCTGAVANTTVTVNTPASVNANADQVVCASLPAATLNGSFGGGASSATWSTSGTGTFNDASNMNAVYTPSAADIAAGSVNLTLTTNDPSGPCDAVSDVMVLVINPVATVSANADMEICANGTAALNGARGGSATSSVWTTAGDGTFDNASLLNAVYTPGVNDIANGSVVLTLTTNDPAGPCNAVADNMTVQIRTAAPAQPAVISGAPLSVCPPVTGINLSVPNDANATTYSWVMAPLTNAVTFNPASATNNQTIDLGTTTNSGYTIRVTATNACGTSAYRSVFIRRSVSTPSYVSGSVVACSNNAYSYSTNTVSGADNYTWNGPAGCLIDGNAAPYTTTNTAVSITMPSGFTTGQVSVAANVACFTSSYKVLNVSAATPAVGPMNGIGTVCPGATQTYSVAAVTGAANYTWTLPNNTSGTSTSNSINTTINAGFTSANICVVANSVCGVASAPRCKTLSTGVPSMPASISGNANGLCAQTTIYTTPAVSGVSYTWTAPAGATFNGNTNNNAVSITMPSNLTTGTVCVKTTNGCGNSNNRCITVKGAPNTPASISSNPGSFCANEAGVEFTANVSNVTGAYSLVWAYPASTTYITGQGTSSLFLDWGANSGVVTLTASNACGQGTKVFNVNLTCREAGNSNADVEFSEIENSINVYPNPAHDVLNINVNALQSENTIIKILDMSGRVVMSRQIIAQQGVTNNTIDVSSFAKGIYMLVAENSSVAIKQRIVIK